MNYTSEQMKKDWERTKQNSRCDLTLMYHPKQAMYRFMLKVAMKLDRIGLLHDVGKKTMEYAKVECDANDKRISDAIFKGMQEGLQTALDNTHPNKK